MLDLRTALKFVVFTSLVASVLSSPVASFAQPSRHRDARIATETGRVPAMCHGHRATIVARQPGGVEGTPGDDVIVALAGTAYISSYGGDDIICAPVLSYIYSGPGDDTIYSSRRDDWIEMGLGDDRLIDHGGQNIVKDSGGNTYAILGDGFDYFSAPTGVSDVQLGLGKDSGEIGRGILRGGNGNDTITLLPCQSCPPGPAVLKGQGAHDKLWLKARGGRQAVLDGGLGRDFLQIDVDRSRSTVRSTLGAEGWIRGGIRAGILTGLEAFADYSDNARDVVVGSDENEYIDTGERRDVIDAGAGRDRIVGGPGSDVADGGAGVDRCWSVETTRNCQVQQE